MSNACSSATLSSTPNIVHLTCRVLVHVLSRRSRTHCLTPADSRAACFPLSANASLQLPHDYLCLLRFQTSACSFKRTDGLRAVLRPRASPKCIIPRCGPACRLRPAPSIKSVQMFSQAPVNDIKPVDGSQRLPDQCLAVLSILLPDSMQMIQSTAKQSRAALLTALQGGPAEFYQSPRV